MMYQPGRDKICTYQATVMAMQQVQYNTTSATAITWWWHDDCDYGWWHKDYDGDDAGDEEDYDSLDDDAADDDGYDDE